jgi:hypothetical protein
VISVLLRQKTIDDLLNQKRQVGRIEAQFGGRDAMMFDVGMNVLVMWMRAGKRQIVTKTS